jgi:RNA polymerase sigma factor (sigma-70 family)
VATGRLDCLIHHLRQAALVPSLADLTDGQLLDHFLTRRDETAFEALMRRLGPMVLGVCRRMLRHEADAEDAFQAAFLVLFQKAGSVRPRAQVANWLYGVACKTALKARARAARRRVVEREAGVMPKVDAAPAAWERLLPLLDGELAQLANAFRAPIVLCDLQGKTRKEAARQLGWPEGTVASRLARGRALLGRRLARHGLAVSAGAVGAALADGAALAAVPEPLFAATVKAVQLVSLFQAVTGVVSAPVAALTVGVQKAMFLTKLKCLTALVVLALVAGGLTVTGTKLARADSDEPAAAQRTESGQKGNPQSSRDEEIKQLQKDLAKLQARLKALEKEAVAEQKKPKIVQIDLNKLPPDLAKKVMELAAVKGGDEVKKKREKDEDDEDRAKPKKADEKKKPKKGDDDDDDEDRAKPKKGDEKKKPKKGDEDENRQENQRGQNQQGENQGGDKGNEPKKAKKKDNDESSLRSLPQDFRGERSVVAVLATVSSDGLAARRD